MKTKFLFFISLVLMVVAMASMFPMHTQAQADGAQRFRAIRVDNSLTVGGNSVLAGDLTLGGALTATDTATFSSQLTAGTFMVLQPATAISLTNSAIITPTASAQPIQSAGAVTVTLSITNASGSTYTAGTMLRLINVSNTTINIADSGNATLSTAWAAGRYDTLTLLFDGNSNTWVEIARSNN